MLRSVGRALRVGRRGGSCAPAGVPVVGPATALLRLRSSHAAPASPSWTLADLDRWREKRDKPAVAEPGFEARVRDSFARQGLMQLLGVRVVDVQPGRVVLEAPYRPDLTQQHDFFHAGVGTSMADSAGGYAAYSLMKPGEDVLATEFKVNLVAPAKGDRLVAVGHVLKGGKTLMVNECEVFAVKDAPAGSGAAPTATRILSMLQTVIRLGPERKLGGR